ncbi:hypothetical protein ACOMHN_016566 [Nucella lapillus]
MELGILHNSPPSTKRGCRAGRLHRLWHGLPPAPWPCTRSQHHSVPSRNLHPLMVPPFLQPHPDLQSAVGNAPLSSKHPAQLPTTDCLLSIISPMGGQPSDAPALSPPSPLQQGGQSSNAPALSPPSPLPQGGQPIALALSPPSPPPQGGQPSDAPGLSPSSSTLLLCPSDSTLNICHLNSQSAVKTGMCFALQTMLLRRHASTNTRRRAMEAGLTTLGQFRLPSDPKGGAAVRLLWMSVVEAGPAGRPRSAQRSVPVGLAMRELVMAIAAMFQAVGCGLVAGAVVVSSPVVVRFHIPLDRHIQCGSVFQPHLSDSLRMKKDRVHVIHSQELKMDSEDSTSPDCSPNHLNPHTDSRHSNNHHHYCHNRAVPHSRTSYNHGGMTLVAAATMMVILTMSSMPLGVEGQERVPIGAASLAFVFDITGSMYDDLVQVIDGAAKILATALFRREKPLYNYVLVPFHDPGEFLACFVVVSFTLARCIV